MNLPKTIPDYTIRRLDAEPFPVRSEELMGWTIVPRLGESGAFALYDQPAGLMTEYATLQVVGRASVHGIEGVEIHAEDVEIGGDVTPHQFVAQLTDTHVRFLAHGWERDGVHQFTTFLDGDTFGDNWGYGEDNCGKEIDMVPRGLIRYENGVFLAERLPVMDVVGRYEVTLGDEIFDTVCVLDAMTYDDGVLSQQFLNREGRTVLWRRFNTPHWRGRDWAAELPHNERLILNGETYIHWYDCLTE